MIKQRGVSNLLIIIFLLVIVLGGGIVAWRLQSEKKPYLPPLTFPPLSTFTSSTSAPPASKSYIEVIYPNGGEIWQEGKTYTIKWKNSPDITKVNIYLQAMDQHPKGAKPATIKVIAENVIANGNYTWVSAEPAGTCFYVFIQTSLNAGPQVSDISNDCFSIIEQNEIADGKIYRNEEYGFEVKYPRDWQTKTSGPEGENLLKRIAFYGSEKKEDLFIEIWKPSAENSQIIYGPMVGLQFKNKNSLVIDGRPTKELRFYGPDLILGGMHIWRLFIIRTDKYVYSIFGDSCMDDNVICDQILSTFKFID